MHCHLIVSRKDQTNKKKLSPLTNHKNTEAGIIKGGFDRVNLFQEQVEQGFDKLFNYNRQQVELFDYHNTMKNGCISELFKLQQQQIQSGERETEINQVSNQENLFSVNLENKKISNISFNTDRKTDRDNDTYIPKIQSGRQESNISPCSLTTFVLSGIDSYYQIQIFQRNKSPNSKRKKGVNCNSLST